MTALHFKYRCPENWESMRLGLHSRFCDNCKKDVIDFTQKSREEILLYILANQDKQICGRLLPSQLDFTHADILVAIQGLTPKQRNSNLPFYILTVGTLILTSCNNTPANKGTISSQQDTLKQNNKIVSLLKNPQSDTIQPVKKKIIDIIDEVPLLGDVIVEPDTAYGRSEPYMFAEVMPEFVGGIDSLMSFLKDNINYPEWEKKNKIQGTVYVSFTIDKVGKIKNTKILRSVTGSKNFDAEVLRVINKMPNWKPGEDGNKKVDVQYNLPIRFTL